MVLVGRRVLQPSKGRAGYVLTVMPAFGIGLGDPWSCVPDYAESYVVVFPPSTDASHPRISRPHDVSAGVWARIWRDIEPCTRFHNCGGLSEAEVEESVRPPALARRCPALAPRLDLTLGRVLFEAEDKAQLHPIYAERAFVDHHPVEPVMQGYRAGDSPSWGLAQHVLTCSGGNGEAPEVYDGESSGDDTARFEGASTSWLPATSAAVKPAALVNTSRAVNPARYKAAAAKAGEAAANKTAAEAKRAAAAEKRAAAKPKAVGVPRGRAAKKEAEAEAAKAAAAEAGKTADAAAKAAVELEKAPSKALLGTRQP